ncbi:Mycoplasma haemagglutinin [Mycoplasmoides gallisepticum]|uniref:Mycoplasma haemagglutinin n=1 Tax=Mycoplasmoides gallisepticum TaxID=2096 RepID=A0A3B0PDV0_MYCGL|nr:Mycoplasma haemagglutinin [Mycoplasmoides gallisepticum]
MPSSVTNQNSRTYTFYVNAPKAGAYYIKGVFTSGISRDLKFSTGDMSSNNNVTVKQLSTGNYSTITLRTFDTSATKGPTQVTTDSTGRKTLTLVEGLNKIVVSGATENMGNAPNFGYLEFILNETQPETTNVSNPS